MRNTCRLLLFIAVLGISVPVGAAPIFENWTAARQSYDVHAVSPDRFVINPGAPPLARGKVAKFTVQPGDKVGSSSGERSEVVLGSWRETSRFRVFGNEGSEFFRISVRLDENWKPPQRNADGFHWGTFFQLHGPDEFRAPPAVALHAEDEFALFVLGGDMEKKIGGRRFLTNADLNLGKWVEFIIAIHWAPDANGSISVFRKDEGETAWQQVADIKSVATLQVMGAQPVRSHYWKAGFYRSESTHTNTLWLGPIVRGKSFDSVAKW